MREELHTDQTDQEWFKNSEWSKLSIKPDLSIDLRMFIKQNILNPKAWQSVYQFMSESNFNNMNEGRYELGCEVYATITDYNTKDISVADYEAHRKFIDIQYVSSGKEYIGLTSLKDIISIVKPYDEANDIEFFYKPDNNLLLADSSRFFVFFPTDGHKPCLNVGSVDKVRKVVVKIPYI
ncbi:MAG: YhcH/YjgK/YiaL family protein [Bacteroidales bacterium]|nr:YhcH/YjgK/YiaL family protein [Paludibacter sp.]MDD3945699.1 YhcH/YjgK/YiaL family protein [Bacteroidales bacterium]